MPRKKTVLAFGEWSKDPRNIEDVLERVLGGQKVEKLCLVIKQPYTLLWPLLNSAQWKERFDAARKGYADGLVEKALTEVEMCAPIKEHVARAKVRADVYLGVAGKWDRDRYGDKIQVEKNVSVTVDAGLVGRAADLLRLASTKERGRVLEAETVTLPAPKGKE